MSQARLGGRERFVGDLHRERVDLGQTPDTARQGREDVICEVLRRKLLTGVEGVIRVRLGGLGQLLKRDGRLVEQQPADRQVTHDSEEVLGGEGDVLELATLEPTDELRHRCRNRFVRSLEVADPFLELRPGCPCSR